MKFFKTIFATCFFIMSPLAQAEFNCRASVYDGAVTGEGVLKEVFIKDFSTGQGKATIDDVEFTVIPEGGGPLFLKIVESGREAHTLDGSLHLQIYRFDEKGERTYADLHLDLYCQ